PRGDRAGRRCGRPAFEGDRAGIAGGRGRVSSNYVAGRDCFLALRGVYSLPGVPLPYGRGSLWGSLVTGCTAPLRSRLVMGFTRCAVDGAVSVGARWGVRSLRGVPRPYGRGSWWGSLVPGCPAPLRSGLVRGFLGYGCTAPLRSRLVMRFTRYGGCS